MSVLMEECIADVLTVLVQFRCLNDGKKEKDNDVSNSGDHNDNSSNKINTSNNTKIKTLITKIAIKTRPTDITNTLPPLPLQERSSPATTSRK